jgi:hypothetical protein
MKTQLFSSVPEQFTCVKTNNTTIAISIFFFIKRSPSIKNY